MAYGDLGYCTSQWDPRWLSPLRHELRFAADIALNGL